MEARVVPVVRAYSPQEILYRFRRRQLYPNGIKRRFLYWQRGFEATHLILASFRACVGFRSMKRQKLPMNLESLTCVDVGDG